MKRKFLKSAFLVAAIALSGYGMGKVYPSLESQSQLLVSNVEALAEKENPVVRYVIIEVEVKVEVTETVTVTYPDGTTRTTTRQKTEIHKEKKCMTSETGPLTNCTV